MKTTIIFIFFFVITLASANYVCAADVWIQFGGFSKHTESSDPLTGLKYNETHPGIGFEYQTKDMFYSAGHTKNSMSRDLNSVIVAKQWNKYLSKELKVSVQLGGGYYTYQGYHKITYNQINTLTGETTFLRDEIVPETSTGFAPWLQTSFQYQDFGINLSFIPGGVIGKNSVSALAIQFKMKIN